MKTRFKVGISVLGLFVASALSATPVRAAVTSLKQVQVSGGNQIDLLFDGKIGRGQIRTEFFNDIIQISLQDAAVYPAKISSVNGGELVKIFAYQYAPRLVRCRLTVKGKAEDFKDLVDLALNGKVLTIRLGKAAEAAARASDAISVSAAQRVLPGTPGDRSPAAKAGIPAEPIKIAASEEKALLEKVMKTPSSPPVHVETKAEPAEDPASPRARERDQPLGGAKPLPSPLKPLGRLAIVLMLFGCLAVGMKKFRERGGSRTDKLSSALEGGLKDEGLKGRGLMGAFAKFAGGGRKREKMIEVLSTHYLGPKKSIAVVKVAGRMLVLGVSNDAISLITQLPADTGLEDADLGELDPSLLGSVGLGNKGNEESLFSSLLEEEEKVPAVAPPRLRSSGQNVAQRGSAAPVATRRPSAGIAAYSGSGPVLDTGSGAYAGEGAYPSYAPAAAARMAVAPRVQSSVRDMIRSKMEGLKPL